MEIGDKLKALIDNPSNGNYVKKGDVGTIVGKIVGSLAKDCEYYVVDFPNCKNYSVPINYSPSRYWPANNNLVLGKFPQDSIVVSLSKATTREVGDMFKITGTHDTVVYVSEGRACSYKKVTSEDDWRLASAAEVSKFNAGITNITCNMAIETTSNDMPEKWQVSVDNDPDDHPELRAWRGYDWNFSGFIDYLGFWSRVKSTELKVIPYQLFKDNRHKLAPSTVNNSTAKAEDVVSEFEFPERWHMKVTNVWESFPMVKEWRGCRWSYKGSITQSGIWCDGTPYGSELITYKQFVDNIHKVKPADINPLYKYSADHPGVTNCSLNIRLDISTDITDDLVYKRPLRKEESQDNVLKPVLSVKTELIHITDNSIYFNI